LADYLVLVYTLDMRTRGFTLLELIVTTAIILLLSTIATISYFRSRQQSKLTRVSTELVAMADAAFQYYQDNNNSYPPETAQGVAPGIEKYIQGGNWPTGPWPRGGYDWDNWIHPGNGQQIYQVSYHICQPGDSAALCQDATLFPNFTQNSSIFFCISGPCIPSLTVPAAPAYCVNCKPKEQNY
jgi:prepilin-type N-terminal cleavage/methylation domain-containing protein